MASAGESAGGGVLCSGVALFSLAGLEGGTVAAIVVIGGRKKE